MVRGESLPAYSRPPDQNSPYNVMPSSSLFHGHYHHPNQPEVEGVEDVHGAPAAVAGPPNQPPLARIHVTAHKHVLRLDPDRWQEAGKGDQGASDEEQRSWLGRKADGVCCRLGGGFKNMRRGAAGLVLPGWLIVGKRLRRGVRGHQAGGGGVGVGEGSGVCVLGRDCGYWSSSCGGVSHVGRQSFV
jgi:hypothetical protein